MAEAQQKTEEDFIDTCIIGATRGVLEAYEQDESDEEVGALLALMLAVVNSVNDLGETGQTVAGVLLSGSQHEAAVALLGPGPYSIAGQALVLQVGDVEVPTAYAKAA